MISDFYYKVIYKRSVRISRAWSRTTYVYYQGLKMKTWRRRRGRTVGGKDAWCHPWWVSTKVRPVQPQRRPQRSWLMRCPFITWAVVFLFP